MGNLRSLKRSIAKNPLRVWRAKQKLKKQLEEKEAAKPKPFELTPDEITKITEGFPKHENESKQEEITT